MKLEKLVKKLGGVLEGDGSVEVMGVAGLEEATSTDLTFLANQKYASRVAETNAAAILVPTSWDRPASCALIRIENSDQAFSKAAELFYENPPPPAIGVHPTAVIDESVQLGKNVSVGAHCVIEAGVVIGDNTIISANGYVGFKTKIGANCFFYPLVSIREFGQIGDRVILHNGAVIGSDGFGYAVQKDGTRTKIPQLGIVVIEDDVEVGANVVIDRARFGKTKIGKGTKIDNLVQIAHNVIVGEHSVLCGQAGIAGSTTLGSRVILAGQCGISGHLTVSDGAIVGAQAGVMKDVPEKAFVIGSPALPHLQFKKTVANTLLLPKLKDRVKQLEIRLSKLEK